jgi:hypothetical protein
MDFTQSKLTKYEWKTTEIPVTESELKILNLIKTGFYDVQYKYNSHVSLFTYLKIHKTKELEDHLFNLYFLNIYTDIKKKCSDLKVSANANPKIKKSDKIRLDNNKQINALDVYEHVLLNYAKNLVYNENNINKLCFHYYTLYQLSTNSVENINTHVNYIVTFLLDKYKPHISIPHIIFNSVEIIEQNKDLLKYKDIQLYEHQKKIFSEFQTKSPKLVLYISPTGTGKTLTPIGLSEKYKIIFVCAARHVGLSLAKSAISINKKVAFAFGCTTASDIRLHNLAAKEYTINNKSGGIGKINNQNGCKVEIMICDIKSYLIAMYYMLAFNLKENIILYWDEPTITLDYEEHELHSYITDIWSNNIIPNIVLSSATLPKYHEIPEVIYNFKSKFENSNVISILSHECSKTIPIYDPDGYIFIPHYYSNNYRDILMITEHCEQYLTLLRYLDLGEIINFLKHIEQFNISITPLFESIDEINMYNIKYQYLQILKQIEPELWCTIYEECIKIRKHPYNNNHSTNNNNNILKTQSIGPGINIPNVSDTNLSITRTYSTINESISIPPQTTTPTHNPNFNIYITTKDAHTLTDGPTIFITNDIDKISQFCLQQSNISSVVMTDIISKIEKNNTISNKINQLEKELEDSTANIVVKETKDEVNNNIQRGNVMKINIELENLRSLLRPINLHNNYIPNKPEHIQQWYKQQHLPNPWGIPFTSNVDEDTIVELMSLHDIADSWKILVLLGIGMFTHHANTKYIELIKKLANNQQLYLIIASSDYIYGTNYQFCHGYISKNMNLTQEKIIQSIGRIGRHNIQNNYSIRCRDFETINMLFKEQSVKPEVINFNKLFI